MAQTFTDEAAGWTTEKTKFGFRQSSGEVRSTQTSVQREMEIPFRHLKAAFRK